MTTQYRPISLFFYIIMSCPTLSLASMCAILGDENEIDYIEVFVNGDKELHPFGIKSNCNRVKMEKGSKVEVWYRNFAHEKQRKILNAGEKIVLNKPGDFFSGVTWTKFKQILSPSASVAGGRRLDDDASIPGFPSGEILLPRGKLVFPVNANLLPKGLNLFSLYEATAANPIFEIRNPKGQIEILAAKLDHEKTYHWVAQSSEESYDDTFRITTKEDQDDFEKQLAESVSGTNGSPLAEGILKAEWCHEYEYFFDRDQALRKVYAASR